MTTLDIQVRRCLKQVAVWRFVGFFSTVVGLLCYARSSSFTTIFGEWSLFKIFLYTVFSLFVCFWSLHAKVCPRSTSLRFKAHSALLLLTITSLYSYFSDKAGNGKPDVYSLISCVAFAIMSFSLSRQTQCGFEVDLLNFFLGCLILLLMKIKLALAIVGVGFSYALIILRSSSDTTSYDNCGVQHEHSVVIDVISQGTDGARMIQQLVACTKELGKNNSNLTNMLLECTKQHLKHASEIKGIDHNFVIDALPLGKINDLEETIKVMVGNGLEKECCDLYCSWRRESLEECLMNLFELHEINTEKESGGVLLEEYIISRWIKVVKIALKILFPSERRLSDRVFSGFSSVADLCFTEVCKGATVQLLNFAEAVASGSPSEWRLSRILEMFETLHDLIPEFQSLLPESLVKEVIKVHQKLGEACREVFMKMEKIVFRMPEELRFAPANGQVHVLTKNIICYLDFVTQAQQNLQKILKQYPVFTNETGKCSLVSDHIVRIMKRLERKLVAMSKHYENPALGYFFVLNNWWYIERRVERWGCDLDCFQKSGTIVLENLELYQRCSWDTVLNLLKLENSESVNPNGGAEGMKENLNLFNLHFESICSTQSSWNAYDFVVSEQIRVSLQNMMLPAYGIFIGRFQDIHGKHANNYIKYGMLDIQDRINQLFSGDRNIG